MFVDCLLGESEESMIAVLVDWLWKDRAFVPSKRGTGSAITCSGTR